MDSTGVQKSDICGSEGLPRETIPCTVATRMKSGSLRKLLLIVLALVVIGGLAYRYRGAFDWSALADSIRHANHGLLLISLAGIYVAYAIRAWRWTRFCRYLGQAHFWRVYRATLSGFAAIFLLGRAGEPIRPILIARQERIPISSMFGIYVLERLFDMASTAALLGVSLLAFPHLVLGGRGDTGWLRTAGTVLLVGLVGAIIFMVYFRFHGAEFLDRKLAGWRSAHGWRARVAGLLAGFSQGLQAIRTFGDLGAAIVSSAVHWTLVVFIYLWISNAFGGRLSELDFPAAMFVLGCTMVGSTVQVPGVGGGSQAATFVAFTRFFGVEREPALATALTLWLITFAGCTLAGIPLLIREGLSVGKLRQLAREEKEAEAAGGHLPDSVSAPKGTPPQ